jgi:hypothetical protein
MPLTDSQKQDGMTFITSQEKVKEPLQKMSWQMSKQNRKPPASMILNKAGKMDALSKYVKILGVYCNGTQWNCNHSVNRSCHWLAEHLVNYNVISDYLKTYKKQDKRRKRYKPKYFTRSVN